MNPLKQRGYTSNSDLADRLHAPPAKRGVYAFPHDSFNFFLVTTKMYGAETLDYRKYHYIKDKDGNKVPYNNKIHISEKIRTYNNYAIINNKPRYITYSGKGICLK